MADEYKKYDSDDSYTNWNARLTKDPEVFPSKMEGKPPLVRLTFVSTSRRENTKDLWIEAKVRDFDADSAAFLKKGDTVGIEGKPVMETYEKNGVTNATFKLDQARTHLSIEMKMKLKERGFTPGARGTPAPAAKAPPKAFAKRPVQDINFGDE